MFTRDMSSSSLKCLDAAESFVIRSRLLNGPSKQENAFLSAPVKYFYFIFCLLKQQLNFCSKLLWKFIYLVSGANIQTRDLLNMSLFL